MEKFLKKVLLHNLWTKLFSLLIAVVIWAAIMNSSDPYINMTIKNVSVTRINEEAVTDKNMIYDVVSGDTLNITVYGPRSQVQSMSVEDINAYVNMKEMSLTESCPIHVEFKDSTSHQNVKLTSKTEEAMIFSLESMVTENKQVVCVTRGKCADGYYAVANVSPSTLEVYGSENAVKKVDRLLADIDVSGRSETFTSEVKVHIMDTNGNEISAEEINVSLPDDKAEVTVNIYKTKNVKIKLNSNVTAGKGFACEDIKMAPESVAIAGPDSVLNYLTEIVIPYEKLDIVETVDENIMLKEFIPEGCYLVSDIDFISVRVVVKPLDENRKITMRLMEFETVGLLSIFEYSMSQTVTISFWGAEGTTDEIIARDLALYLDFTGITSEGKYTIPVQSKMTRKDIMIDPVSVEIELKMKGYESDPTKPEQ